MAQEEPITALLQGEHQAIDARFARFSQALAAGRIDASPFREAASALHRHIYLEEDLLFPEVESRGLVGPTAVMAQEHGEICRSLDRVEALIQTHAGAAEARRGNIPSSPGVRRLAALASIQDELGRLRGLLAEHNLKEERVLYPAADRMLDGARVAGQLRESDAPDGWKCRAHRGEG